MTDGADPLVRMWLERPDGRATVAVLVRVHEAGRIEVRGADGRPAPDLAPGARARLLRAVQEDAQYATSITVEHVAADDAVWAREVGTRERLQQREHVRTATPPLDLTITVPATGDDEPRVVPATLLDLSAGGLRVGHEPPVLPRGVPLRVEVLLPGEGGPDVRLDARAEARRVVEDADGDGLRSAAGLMLLELPRLLEQRLVQWVFSVQASRRREGRGR